MAVIGNQINAAVGNWNAGRTTRIADAHRDGKRLVVRADAILTTILETERGHSPVCGEFDLVIAAQKRGRG
jgi:hypothetical protein